MSKSDMPWIDEYETCEWNVYHLPLKDKSVHPPLQTPDKSYQECAAESEYARRCYTDYKRNGGVYRPFYYDLKQMAADLEVYGAEALQVLSQSWNGHPAGSLVLMTYQGVTDEEPSFTYLVETPSA